MTQLLSRRFTLSTLLAAGTLAACMLLPQMAGAVMPAFSWTEGSSTPAGYTNTHQANFNGYNSSRNVSASSVTCQVTNNGGASAAYPCTLGNSDGNFWFSAGTSILSEGFHQMIVKATPADGSGQVQTLTRDITVDWTAPYIGMLSGPTGTIVGHEASFNFSANETSTYQCRLDGDDSSWTSCTSGQSYSSIADGEHTFHVRPTDQAGNTGSEATRTFTVFNGPPAASFAEFDSPTSDATPTIGVNVNRPDAHAECKLDGGEWELCDGAYAPGNDIAEGSHTISVRAYVGDHADVQATPDTETLVIDLTAPEVHFTNTTTAFAGWNATIEFASASEDNDGFMCAVDGNGYSPCSSPFLQEYVPWEPWSGDHTISVKAVDGASNASEPITRTYRIYPDLPGTFIASAPDASTPVAVANFKFDSDTGSKFECSIDNGPYSECPESYAVSGLSGGLHTLRVRAVDPVGQTDETPATANFVLTSPVVPLPEKPKVTTPKLEEKKLGITVSGAATVTVKVEICKKKKIKGKTKTVCSKAAKGSATATTAGKLSIKLNKKLKKKVTYRVTITATDASGQITKVVKTLKFK